MRSFVITSAALAAICVIGWLDVVTGPDYGLSLCYLVPIAVSAVCVGHNATALTAVAAGVAWLMADLLTTHVPLGVSVWNGATRVTIYYGVGALLATLRHERDRLRALTRELHAVAAREAELARTDGLTGLANSRYLRENIEREVARCRRDGNPIALAYVDLDNFKRVNDSQGHGQGDALLCTVAHALRDSIRASDQCGRLGGDEFAVLVADADSEQASAVMWRFAEKMREIARRYPGCELGASIGIACACGPLACVETLMREADTAMYEAKAEGKNKIVVHGTQPSGPRERWNPEPPTA